MDDWEKFNKTTLPEKEDFGSHLNMDYVQPKRVCKDFEIKHLGEYNDFLTDIDLLLMIEKGIKGRICHYIYRYAKANIKYMKDCNKTKESSYLQYWDVNPDMIGQRRKSFH